MINRLRVAGYKSVAEPEIAVDLRPLTVFAGANSSGKSSLIQPLLLLKQTLEATYDPGPLRLDGPNVRFTEAQQLFHRVSRSETLTQFHIGIDVNGRSLTTHFKLTRDRGLEVVRTRLEDAERATFDLRPGLSQEEITRFIPEDVRAVYASLLEMMGAESWEVVRDRCFLEIRPAGLDAERAREAFFPSIAPYGPVTAAIRDTIHIPGLRGNPLRTYPVSAVGTEFPGTFERYAASVIADWQQKGDEEKLQALGADLLALDLTWKVRARPISDTEVELQVGRLPRAAQGGAWDLVSIADVGFGVSQSLPILVALRAAKPGQVVYFEQPEIHLHPRAQYKLAAVLAGAVKRGVRMVVETHSSVLLVALQTLVANEDILREDLILHWFTRSPQGDTSIATAELDDDGSFGEWPEDFGNVLLEAEARYLDAASKSRSQS